MGKKEEKGNKPQRLRRTGVVVHIVEGVDLAQGAEGVLEVVDDGAGHEGLGAIRGNARAEVDVMVDGGLFVVRVSEVGFLCCSSLGRIIYPT
jgi:hypothetical protein